jgi:DNA-binding TFAR19-related protein (PDSD5 family)
MVAYSVDNYLQNWFSKGRVSINILSYEIQKIYRQINKDYLQSLSIISINFIPNYIIAV